MSSFSFFTPTASSTDINSFGPCSSSFNSISSNSPPIPTSKPPKKTRKKSKHILNPSAASYIPQKRQIQQDKLPEIQIINKSLNAGAKPYIPLPLIITKNDSKSRPNYKPLPAKKISFPSFACYEKLQSHQIYNATKHINDTRSQLSSLSSVISSMEDTPIPASVTASAFDDDSDIDSENEIMHIDLDNIKPYIPTDHHKPDIDLVYNISNKTNITNISNVSAGSPQPQNVNVINEDKVNECDIFSDNDIDSDSLSSDDDIHPVLAALNAPIWSPDDIDADTDSENDLTHHHQHQYRYTEQKHQFEEKEEKQLEQLTFGEKRNITFSRVAVEEEDYQYIIHPTKKPIKYSYMDTRKINTYSESKVAMDDNMIYPPHIQYMQQYQYGGSYIIQRMHSLSLSATIYSTYSSTQTKKKKIKTYITRTTITCGH